MIICELLHQYNDHESERFDWTRKVRHDILTPCGHFTVIKSFEVRVLELWEKIRVRNRNLDTCSSIHVFLQYLKFGEMLIILLLMELRNCFISVCHGTLRCSEGGC